MPLNAFGQSSTIIYATDFNITGIDMDTLGWGELSDFGTLASPETLQKRSWILTNQATPTNKTGPDTAQSGSYYAYFEHTCGLDPCIPNDTLVMISPEINLSGTNSQLSFWYLLNGAATPVPSKLTVSVLSDNLATRDIVWGPIDNGLHPDSTHSSWQEKTINLSAYDGETIRIEFTGNIGQGISSRGDIGIDNFTIKTDLTIAQPIPTLSEWSLLVLGLLLLITICVASKNYNIKPSVFGIQRD